MCTGKTGRPAREPASKSVGNSGSALASRVNVWLWVGLQTPEPAHKGAVLTKAQCMQAQKLEPEADTQILLPCPKLYDLRASYLATWNLSVLIWKMGTNNSTSWGKGGGSRRLYFYWLCGKSWKSTSPLAETLREEVLPKDTTFPIFIHFYYSHNQLESFLRYGEKDLLVMQNISRVRDTY